MKIIVLLCLVVLVLSGCAYTVYPNYPTYYPNYPVNLDQPGYLGYARHAHCGYYHRCW